MTEKLSGIHDNSLFIDGIEVLRVVKIDSGKVRTARGAPLGTAIEYLDDPKKLGENRRSFLEPDTKTKSKLH